MLGFLTSRLGVACIAAVVALGAFWWVYEEGKDAERTKGLETTIEETDDARRDREAAERRAVDRDFCEQLNRLPGPRITCP